MQDCKAPSVISISDSGLNANLPRLFQIVLDSCLGGATEEVSLGGKPNGDGFNHTAMKHEQFFVVSVIGPPGSGKSFLANWIAKYWAANGARCWTSLTDPNEALDGFVWNPYFRIGTSGQEQDDEGAATPASCVRMLRVLPILSLLQPVHVHNDNSDALQFEEKRVRGILLDVDAQNKQNEKFKANYTTLVASCMLISNLTIYIDVDISKHHDSDFDIHALLTLLKRDLSMQPAELVVMRNRHFTDSETSSSQIPSILKSFCTARKIPFALYDLPSLKAEDVGQNFLGALQHMKSDELTLATARMAGVAILLRKPSHTTQSLFDLVQSVIKGLNEIGEVTAPAFSEIVSKEEEIKEEQQGHLELGCSDLESKVDDPLGIDVDSGKFTTLRAEQKQQSGLSEPEVVELPGPEEGLREEQGSYTESDEISQEGNRQDATSDDRCPNPSDENQVSRLPPASEEEKDNKYGEQEQKDEVPTSPNKDPPVSVFNQQQPGSAYCRNEYVKNFLNLIQNQYLQHFMASPAIRAEVVDALCQLVLKNMEGAISDLRDDGLQYLGQEFDAWICNVGHIIEAIDKGRNVILAEFGSRHFLDTEAELEKLLIRAKALATDRLAGLSGPHTEFFAASWNAVEMNTRLRNGQVRKHEQRIKEALQSQLLEFYSTEVEQLVNAEAESETVDLLRLTAANAKLIADCVEMLKAMKAYWSPGEGNFKAELEAQMNQIFSDKSAVVGSRIQSRQAELEGDKMRKSVCGPSTKHRIPRSERRIADKGAVRTSTAPASNGGINSCFLVFHLGRTEDAGLGIVSEFYNDKPIFNIPGLIAVAEKGQFVIGNDARNIDCCLHIHELRAGSRNYTMTVEGGVQQFRYEVLVGIFLAKCKRYAEEISSHRFSSTILVIPALSTSVDREALQDAAIIAGFDRVRLVSEPTVVAFDYFQTQRLTSPVLRSGNWTLVLYLGGQGEKEFALFKMSEDDRPPLQMMALSGDRFLGFLKPTSSRGIACIKKPTEYELYSNDLATMANISQAAFSSLKMAVTGDSDSIVQQSLRYLDTWKKHGFSQTREDAAISAVWGGILLAQQAMAGRTFRSVIAERLYISVALYFSSGSPKPMVIFPKNRALPARHEITLAVSESCAENLHFDLVNEVFGIRFGTYIVQVHDSNRPAYSGSEQSLQLTIEMTVNGILHVRATLSEKGGGLEPPFHLRVVRTDKENLTAQQRDGCAKYVRNIISGSGTEEPEKLRVKVELKQPLKPFSRALDINNAAVGTELLQQKL